MKKRCVVCGKPIRTGWKYCYKHRHARERKLQIDARHLRKFIPPSIMPLVLLVVGVSLLFSEVLRIVGVLLILGILILFFVRYNKKPASEIMKHRTDLTREQKKKELIKLKLILLLIGVIGFIILYLISKVTS